MTERRVDVGGGKTLYVRDEGSGPPLLFVHSLTFSGQMFAAQLAALQDRYRVLVMDMPGHGKTTWGEPGAITIDDLSDDVIRLLDVLDIERVGYAGHSTGGMIGLRLGLRHPERVGALALLNTTAEAEPPEQQELYDKLNESTRGVPSNEATCNFIMSLMFSAPFREAHPEQVAPFFDLLMNPPHNEGAYWMGKAVIWREPILEQVAGITIPTLVVVSEDDVALPKRHGEAIAAGIEGAKLVRLAGGHVSPVERAAEVTAALRTLYDEALS